MVKRVCIVHGWDGSPDEPMHKWFKDSLEEEGYKVIIPEMPEAEEPKIEPWVNKLYEVIPNPDEDTYFIGHSIGCQAILRYLEKLPVDVKIAGVVLIAPWMYLDEKTIEEEGEEVKEIARPWMETKIDYSKIKSHINKIIAMFSSNDPYVPISNKYLFSEKLGAEIIVEENKGHYDPDSGIVDNPTALKALLEMST